MVGQEAARAAGLAVSRADFDHACAHLAAAGCSLGVARYEHEIMGGWIIEARCPNGDWLLAFDGQRVSFLWRDYAHGNKQRVMTLEAVEFLRRFFLHVLPLRFVRIRHYGLLANRSGKQLLPLAHQRLADQGRPQLAPPPPPDPHLWHCPRCGKAMRVVQRFTAAQLHFAGFDTS